VDFDTETDLRSEAETVIDGTRELTGGCPRYCSVEAGHAQDKEQTLSKGIPTAFTKFAMKRTL
jgi:hypothetical protein